MDIRARILTTELCGPSPVEALLRLSREEMRLLLPELIRLQEIELRGGTAFQHTLHVLQYLPIRTPVSVWSAIFHDVGKAYTHRAVSNSPDRNHADASAAMTETALGRLAFDFDIRRAIVRLVRTHMQDLYVLRNDRDIESFIARIGLNNLSDWFALRKADCLAYGNGSSLSLVSRTQKRVDEFLSQTKAIAIAPSVATSVVTGNGAEAACVPAVIPVQYRPDWDTWYMLIAYLVASRSHDPSTQHGAVFADSNHRPLGWGYNGCPSGCDDHLILSQRPLKYYAVIHAEENGMLYAPRDLIGSTLYVTGMPCSRCWAKIIAKGIARVVYGTIPSKMLDEQDAEARELLLAGRIQGRADRNPELPVIRVDQWRPEPEEAVAIASLFAIIRNKINLGG